ncbi:MAG: hypothetical protein ACYTAQ_10750 [Planctomycetota bacterium]|jgi:hypothetical protein
MATATAILLMAACLTWGTATPLDDRLHELVAQLGAERAGAHHGVDDLGNRGVTLGGDEGGDDGLSDDDIKQLHASFPLVGVLCLLSRILLL